MGPDSTQTCASLTFVLGEDRLLYSFTRNTFSVVQQSTVQPCSLMSIYNIYVIYLFVATLFILFLSITYKLSPALTFMFYNSAVNILHVLPWIVYTQEVTTKSKYCAAPGMNPRMTSTNCFEVVAFVMLSYEIDEHCAILEVNIIHICNKAQPQDWYTNVHIVWL